jgi:pimeloyl-ACP methyl ester carboxylesterase
MLIVPSADGVDVRAYDEGRGEPILIIGPGMDDGTRTKKLAAILARRFRVLRLHRRQYRLDLKAKTGGAPYSVAQEVQDVIAIAEAVGRPLLVYGHSSGGVVALEALVAAPSLFVGAVIFEPAIVSVMPLGRDGNDIIREMRADLASGKPGRALAIFASSATGLPARQAALIGLITTVVPRYRRLVPSQADDLQAMVEVGAPLDTYARIDTPLVLLGGDRNPAGMAAPLDALQEVIRGAERIVMHGRDHGADLKVPGQVAEVIEKLADRTFTRKR